MAAPYNPATLSGSTGLLPALPLGLHLVTLYAFNLFGAVTLNVNFTIDQPIISPQSTASATHTVSQHSANHAKGFSGFEQQFCEVSTNLLVKFLWSHLKRERKIQAGIEKKSTRRLFTILWLPNVKFQTSFVGNRLNHVRHGYMSAV